MFVKLPVDRHNRRTMFKGKRKETVILSSYSQSDSVRDFVGYCLFIATDTRTKLATKNYITIRN